MEPFKETVARGRARSRPREQWPAQRRSAPVGGGGHGGVLLNRRHGHGDGGAPGLGGQGAVGRRGGAGGLHAHAADDEDDARREAGRLVGLHALELAKVNAAGERREDDDLVGRRAAGGA